jgi:hypothetical protein
MIAAKVQWLVFWEVIVGEARQKKDVKQSSQGSNIFR